MQGSVSSTHIHSPISLPRFEKWIHHSMISFHLIELWKWSINALYSSKWVLGLKLQNYSISHILIMLIILQSKLSLIETMRISDWWGNDKRPRVARFDIRCNKIIECINSVWLLWIDYCLFVVELWDIINRLSSNEFSFRLWSICCIKWP